MTATISGLGSGFDINTIVSQLVAVKQSSTVTPLTTKLNTLNSQNSAVSTLKGKYSSLQSSLQTFTKTLYNSSSDMWSKMSISSSDDAFATASAQGSVSASEIELKIEQIATSTTATSVKSIGNATKDDILNAKYSNIANGQTKEGSFSMFLNGKQYKIDIATEDTIGDIISKISDVSKGEITADVSNDGIFTIKANDENSTLILGSNADTSNFESALKLDKPIGKNGYESAYSISTVNSSIALNDEASGIIGLKFYQEDGTSANSGTITINGVDIEIDDSMSLDKIINKINNTSDVGVKASFDALTNKVTLISSQTGQNNISLSSKGTNLLNVLGLTEGEGENEIITKDSQTLGQNAIAYINGNRVVSSSNTITGESSGIANLSITIKKPTSDYSKNSDDPDKVKLNVSRDNSAVVSAVEKFISAYNDVVETTKSYTASDGKIGYDSALNSILSNIRSITSQVVDTNGSYNMLSQIGISTSKDDVTKLTLDKDKLEKALNSDVDSVKFLLSDGHEDKNDTGIFDTVLSKLNNVLDTTNGYFATKTSSFDTQIKTLNNRIDRANEQLSKYQTRITEQFNRMDTLISNLNSQLTTFNSYFS